jgi:hypothetical protein
LIAGAAALVTYMEWWPQVGAAAQVAIGIISQAWHSLALIKTAIANLFAGNFAKAWDQFKEGAVAAFQTLAQAAQQAEGPVGALARGFATFLKDLPGAILLVAKMFGALGMAAQFVVDTINKFFGTDLNVTDIALIAIVLQLTGGLTALAAVVGIVGGALAGLVSAFSLAGTVLGGLLAAFGGLGLALIAGAAALVTYMEWWPQVGAAAQVAIGIISQAWQGFVLAFTNGLTILAPLWQGFIAAFMNGLTIIGGAVQLFVSAFMNGLTIIANAGIAAWQAIQTGWQNLGATLQAGIDAVVGAFANAWAAIQNAGTQAMAAVQGAIDAVIGTVNNLISAIGTAIQSLLQLIGLGGNPGQSGSTGSWATGGYIGGRGSGTSDSNLAWVSRGEHIMPARAVRQPGVLAFLEALRRSGGNLGRVLDGMGRFARGGMVPSFASGGMTGMSNVTIQFPGLPDVGGLRAQPSAIEQLHRVAVMAQVRSGGRKPSRYS